MEELKSTYPLIHNKVTSPHYVTPTLRRARLIDWLNDHAQARAMVIAAGAGYGKTTLLWQWEREVDFPCYWYKLDRNDRDWTLHISYLVEALSTHYPGFGRRAHSVLRQMGGPGSSRPGVASYLLSDMHDQLKEPCTFIIDDWQYVASVTEVRGLWNQILRDAPPTCRFIFASRGKPQLQFARLKTHAGYAELRTDDLRVTGDEIQELFRDVYRNPLTADEAEELERRTEGWAASLQLIQVSLRDRRTPEERRSLIDSITATRDSDLFQFLAEEVLDQQSDETRNFLLSTSILQQITPDIAERLAGVHDGLDHLLKLEHAGLFTNHVDDVRYRYHGLFREFLEQRLESERTEAEVLGLHIHAASYYETHEQWPNAIYHFLQAGLQRQAARLIARYGEEVVGEGRIGMVDQWLQRMPVRTVRDNARLSLLHGEVLGMSDDRAGALAALERARLFFERKQDARMEALALLKESSVYHSWGEPDTSADLAKRGLAIAPLDARDLRLRLEGNIAITAVWLHEPLTNALQTISRVTAEAARMGLDHYAAIGMHNLGVLHYEMGALDQAIHWLERAEQFWDELSKSPFGDNYNLVRALLAIGNTEAALKLARQGEDRTRAWPRPHAEAVAGLALALVAGGKPREAIETIRPIVFADNDFGGVSENARIHYIEIIAQSSKTLPKEALLVAGKLRQTTDPRSDAARETALAFVDHQGGTCSTDCARKALSAIDELARRGAAYQEVSLTIWLAQALLAHHGRLGRQRVARAVSIAIEMGTLGGFKGWLRTLGARATELVTACDETALKELVAIDPEFWIPAVSQNNLAGLSGESRIQLIGAMERHARLSTVRDLATAKDPDLIALRARLVQRQAPRLFIRTFGPLTIQKTSWDGPRIGVAKRRTRSLLALLTAGGNESLTRDGVVDALWPDASPAAAVNNLNQTLFQLRRAIDPAYKDGYSPQYVLSTPDVVELNGSLVRFDWVEVLKRAASCRGHGQQIDGFASYVSEIVTGEFLAEFLYEDWSARPRRRIHEQIRDSLLPLASGAQVDPRSRARLAGALASLDSYDEAAHIVLAKALADMGRRSAAYATLSNFATRIRDEFGEAPPPEVIAAADELGFKSISTGLRAS
jgi:ATP/maltotriose-dependent transcriptional regulator MalT/DNA-binding SARP family transcriptional activator